MSNPKVNAAREYSRPKLVVYGSFSDLTASGSTMANENTGMAMNAQRFP